MISYYRKPHRYKKKESFLKNKVFWFSLLGLSLVSGLVYFLYFSAVFQAKEVIVNREGVEEKPGVLLVSQGIMDEARRLADGALESKLIFWRTKSIFLFDSGNLEKEISGLYPELKEIKIRKKWPGTINIDLTRKEGVALLSAEEGLFLLDETGKVFSPASSTDEGLPVLIKSDYSVESDENAVSKEYLDKILYAEKELKALEIIVDNFLLFSKDKLIARVAEGWEAYFTLEEDLDWQIQKLESVLNEKVPLEQRGDLEYIDVRFSNMVFPKYKD